ncbi:MAG: hypothetical protein HC912_04080 [Saprospiraceae bacterium]|nr:hypothetical protein [Saprospiraceae bacterium]
MGEVQVNGSINPLVLGAGLYQLEVSNSRTGCIARDTVQVTTTPNPIVNAGEDQVFDCSTEEISLDCLCWNRNRRKSNLFMANA